MLENLTAFFVAAWERVSASVALLHDVALALLAFAVLAAAQWLWGRLRASRKAARQRGWGLSDTIVAQYADLPTRQRVQMTNPGATYRAYWRCSEAVAAQLPGLRDRAGRPLMTVATVNGRRQALLMGLPVEPATDGQALRLVLEVE